MDLTLKLLGILFILVGLFLAYLSTTQVVPETGLFNGKLRPCDPKPSCVSTESGDPPPLPLPFPDDRAATLAGIGSAIEKMGGSVIEQNREYLWAEFTSRIFRFKDDLEIRVDEENGIVHARSESRVGHSDFGVNKRRIETLRSALK